MVSLFLNTTSWPPADAGFGENDCAHGYADSYMTWADAHGLSYLGWTWNPWDCGGGPALISDWNGTPTAYGAGLRDHLAALVAAHRSRRADS